MRCPPSSAESARPRKRQTNSPHEIDAASFWTPAKVYEEDYELPDWVAGAN